MNRVLIIGSKGMLGQELVSVFSPPSAPSSERRGDAEYEVVGWDRDEIDIADFEEAKKQITKLKPDIIINSAAYNAVDDIEKSEDNFEKARIINGEAPGNLAEIAKEIGAKFVQYSSDYVFDGHPAKSSIGCSGVCATCPMHGKKEHEQKESFPGYEEDDFPNPISQYGISKLLGELNVQRKMGDYYIIRLSKLFGKPGVSEGGKKSFFDVMLELGRKNKEVKVVNAEVSNFTYAPDLAEATKNLLESDKPSGIYHVTNSGGVTWFEAVKELYKLAGLKTEIISVTPEEFPRLAKRPVKSVLLNTKLEPLRDWKEALKEYLGSLY